MTEGTVDRQLRERARAVIPGGMYGHQAAPGAAYPQFMLGGRGARVWDVDGSEYVDLMCSYGPVVLGHQHPAVEAAARAQTETGDCMNSPGPVMVDLAELLVATVRHADWAIFAKNGTDATTMCGTIARAQTGRSKILVAKGAYHGAAPWCTPRPAGVTAADHANLGYYTFNDLASVRQAAAEAGDDLAGILVSPFKHDAGYDQELVDPAFARGLRALCDAAGAALILDDVRCGFRLHLGSSWEPIGVDPDLSAWSKAIANGRALAAVLGNDAFRGGAKQVFVTGSFWFSAVPMAAAIATIRALKDEKRHRDDAPPGRGAARRDPGPGQVLGPGRQLHRPAGDALPHLRRGSEPRAGRRVRRAGPARRRLPASPAQLVRVRRHDRGRPRPGPRGDRPGLRRRPQTPRPVSRRTPMSSTAAEPGTSRARAAQQTTQPIAEAVLERAGYQPELRRSLRFFSMFAIAFSIISITTGIFLNYGFGLAYWGPAVNLDLAGRRGLQHDDRPGRGRTRHPHPAGRLRLPVERPAGEPHLRLVRRLRRAALHGRRRRRAFGTLVGATAIIPYIIYFLITLAYAIKRRTLDSLPGAFNLGRWAWPVIGFVLVYTVLVMLVLSLPAPFHGSDKVLGYGLALAALWYFGGLLWRLKKGTAGVKPVEDLVDPPGLARRTAPGRPGR